MADHWKSTNRYWCKFCSDFIKDTTFDRKNHETSPKHQNAIQRSLREIHKNKAKEDRDKQRARDEVARVTGVVSGKKPDSNVQGAPDFGQQKGHEERKATPAERRAQMEQLMAMGIKLPGETQKEVTGVGEWEVVSKTVVEMPVYNDEGIKKEEDCKDGILSSTNNGVRKRRVEDEEEDVRDEETMSKRKQYADWGSKFKRFPVPNKAQADENLEALLNGVGETSASRTAKSEIKTEGVKEEESEEKPLAGVPPIDASGEDVKREESAPAVAAPVFKKRKTKKWAP